MTRDHDPVLVFHKTSAETNGEAVVFDTFVQPDGFVAAAHVHPSRRSGSRLSRARSGSRSAARRPSPARARR